MYFEQACTAELLDVMSLNKVLYCIALHCIALYCVVLNEDWFDVQIENTFHVTYPIIGT